jgi:hypothetical protein
MHDTNPIDQIIVTLLTEHNSLQSLLSSVCVLGVSMLTSVSLVFCFGLWNCSDGVVYIFCFGWNCSDGVVYIFCFGWNCSDGVVSQQSNYDLIYRVSVMHNGYNSFADPKWWGSILSGFFPHFIKIFSQIYGPSPPFRKFLKFTNLVIYFTCETEVYKFIK